MSATDKCPDCGMALSLHKDCPLCRGTGEVERPSFATPRKMLKGTCSVCRGTGKLRDCIRVLWVEIERLRGALEPFARVGQRVKDGESIYDAMEEEDVRKIRDYWLRAAKAQAVSKGVPATPAQGNER